MTRAVNLAYYKKEDWQRFLQVIDDRNRMHKTWNEWHDSFLETKRMLISQGLSVYQVTVNLDELISYCVLKGIKNDSKARSQFVSEKLPD